jgi:hypothetical protein
MKQSNQCSIPEFMDSVSNIRQYQGDSPEPVSCSSIQLGSDDFPALPPPLAQFQMFTTPPSDMLNSHHNALKRNIRTAGMQNEAPFWRQQYKKRENGEISGSRSKRNMPKSSSNKNIRHRRH